MSKKAPRCYIDSNVIIDYVTDSCGMAIRDQRKEEMDYVEKILIAAKDGSILLFTSDITKLECHSADNPAHITDEIKRLFKSVLDSGQIIRCISANSFIIEQARDMHWNGFPLPNNMDKIHISSAIFAKCNELITFDGFRRSHYKNSVNDFACIEELCKQHNISVVFPSESCVARAEYAEYVKNQKLNREEKERKRQVQCRLFDAR